jgi:HEAT repeat protein
VKSETGTRRAAPLVLSPKERARLAELQQLAAKGEAGVAGLVAHLGERSWPVRREVVRALATLGDVAAPALVADPLVVELASHADPAVVSDAAQILGRRRSRTGVPALAALTEHADDNVAVAAVEALGRIGGRAAVDSLITAVTSGRFFRSFPAIDVLGRTGDPRAVAPLRQLLDDPQYAIEALRALGHTGDPGAVAAIAPMLGKGGDAVVRVASVALAELHRNYNQQYGPSDAIEQALANCAPPSALRSVARALAHANAMEQEEMCWVLGSLGGEDAISDLEVLLDAPAPVARAAARALERIGEAAADRVETALREGDSARRKTLLPSIVARLYSIDAILECLDDPEPAVRVAACDALTRAGNPAAVPRLFELLGDPDYRVVQCVTSAVQALGSAQTEGLALTAARSTDKRVRMSAFRILAYFGYSSALPLFLEAIHGDDARLRDVATQGLAFVDGPEALDALFEMARHPEGQARSAAMRALSHASRDERGRAYLMRGLSDPDAWVRYYA